MAALGRYTTTNAVRGCLGIDANDCPDAYMLDSKLDVELTLDLDSWLASHAPLYAAGIASGATSAEESIADRISMYAQWFCAAEMADRPFTVPHITTDGKAQIDRFKVDLERVSALAHAKKAKYRAELDVLVNNAAVTVHGLNYVGVAAPDQDPITDGIQ